MPLPTHDRKGKGKQVKKGAATGNAGTKKGQIQRVYNKNELLIMAVSERAPANLE